MHLKAGGHTVPQLKPTCLRIRNKSGGWTSDIVYDLHNQRDHLSVQPRCTACP